MPSAPLASSAWTLYNSTVADYTQRQLTVASDRLPAILGILRSFGRYSSDVFLCGLPVKQFPYSLLWHPPGGSERLTDGPAGRGSVGRDTPSTRRPTRCRCSGAGGRGPRTFVSALKHLRFRGEDGVEVLIDQTPWLNGYLARSQCEYDTALISGRRQIQL